MSTLVQDEQIFEIHRRTFDVLANIILVRIIYCFQFFLLPQILYKTDVTNNNIKYNFRIIVHYCLAL